MDTTKATIKEIANLFSNNNHEIYEVGGSVRDSILKRKFSDIDFAVSCTPETTLKILNEYCIDKDCSVYTVGIVYGTVGLMFKNGLRLEFTTYRGEVYPQNSRKPLVRFGTNLFDDLARRDFNVNAIVRNPLNDEIIDPHNGIKDIREKVIRCVGSNSRLNEDPLRMMRAIRFACQLNFSLDIKIDNPERLTVISQERIRDEFSKILLSPQPKMGIKWLCDMGLMQFIIPELLELQGLEQGHSHVTNAFNHTLMVLDEASKINFNADNLVFRLSALLHDIGKKKSHIITETGPHFYEHHIVGSDMAREILTRLTYDNTTIERVSNLVFRHMEPIMMGISNTLNKKSVSRLIRRLENDKHNDIEILLALNKCDMSTTSDPKTDLVIQLREMVDEIKNALPEQKSPISGSEIMELLNLKPCKLVGEIKDYVIECISEGVVKLEDKDSMLKLIKEKYG